MPASLRTLAGLARTTAMLGLVVTTAVGCDTAGARSAPPPASGCPAAETKALALVLGAHANSPAPQPSRYVNTLLDAAVDAKAPVVVVRVDGSPETVFSEAFRTNGQNDPARAADRKAYIKRVKAVLRSTKAERPEADPLTALALAARAVGPGGTVAIVDSGLQTVAPLDFRESGVLDAEPGDVAAFLARNASLPQLTGINVVLNGIGDTAVPQESLPLRRQGNLVAIWQAIAQKAKAACVSVDTTPRQGHSLPDTPAVSRVPVPAVETYTAGCGDHVLRNDGSVGFKPDLAVLRDPEAARTALRELAGWATTHDAKVRLTGTTASAGTEAGRTRLSLQRAEAVRTLLVDLGVPADRITVRGVGINWPGYVMDRADGTLLPGPAEHNRSVILTLTC
ncbi:OmpA family protein [Streptomyces sp. ME02-8801-2C]|uniref:OmpA family protein n=1 Tax=Streptomyces sp. ME02-8801-2C TaxID=3028680 RepID=UPI0029B54779|nr:OmpA family protein [Streptomyces sp. ME02-8801-2C]MDX3455456.1 OmpA family protein [Streptomyces sp. ME02-8801-2C]